MKSLVWQQNLHQKVFYRGALHLCNGAWHSEIWTNITVLWCFILQFGKGAWSFVSEGISPQKLPCGDWTVWQNFSLLFHAIDSEKYLGLRNMSSLQYMSNFVFISMTGPKVIQHIQVSTLLREAKSVLGLFCLHLNTIAWSSHITRYTDNWLGFKSLWLGFWIRVYGQGLGSRFRCRGSMFGVRV